MASRLKLIAAIAVVGLLALGAASWWLWQGRAAAATPVLYVALGASDAVGVGADQPAADGWVPLVRDGLPTGTRGTQLVNLGIDGATLADVLSQEMPIAVDTHPDLVTLWSGVNDLRDGVSLETFGGQLDSLLGRLGGARTRVVVLDLPDLRLLPAFNGQDSAALDATVQRWNAVIAAAAARHGAVLVDLYAARAEFAHHPEYVSADGLHPSSAGYRRIADLVLKAIDNHAASTAP
ncbi:MAG TPA: GDSL-type esterase/lipase family protein [Thermomicrobiaceae bacterium]|nr:GDSL-type esterase/lipase family protein [Thermomicrobiaceae bacterium]